MVILNKLVVVVVVVVVVVDSPAVSQLSPLLFLALRFYVVQRDYKP